jgi:hypothetical protein
MLERVRPLQVLVVASFKAENRFPLFSTMRYGTGMDRIVFAALLLGSSVYALARGGKPERWTATLFLAAAVASYLALGISKLLRFKEVEWGVFAIDVALFAGLLIIALRANRYWTMCMPPLQLISLCSHVAYVTIDARHAWAYSVAEKASSFPMLIILMVGTWRYRRRLRQTIATRSNGSSSEPAAMPRG